MPRAHLSRRFGGLGAAVLLLSTAFAVTATPALASTTAPWHWAELDGSVTVPPGSTADWVAQCPFGYTPVSGGIIENPAGVDRILDYPSDYDRSYHLQLRNRYSGWAPVTLAGWCASAAEVGDIYATHIDFARNSLGYAGGVVYCPDGMGVLSGSADWNTTGIRRINFSSPTKDAGGWYATGQSATSGDKLTIEVRCVPTSRLTGEQVRVATSAVSNGTDLYRADATCPAGTRILTGGGYGSVPAQPLAPGANHGRAIWSGPSRTTGWTVQASLPQGDQLTTVAVCIAAFQPSVSFTVTPAALSNSANFEYSVTNPGGGSLTFSCAVDYVPQLQPCDWLGWSGDWVTAGPLTDGVHTFYMKVTNDEGQSAVASYQWTYDGTPPRVTSVSPLSDAPITGPIFVTFSEPVVGVDATSVQVTADGAAGPVPGRVTVNGTTAWWEPTSPLTPGGWYTLAPQQTIHDPAGNSLVYGTWRIRASTHVENSSPAVVESWDPDTSSLASGGAYISSRTAGSAASLAFTASAGDTASVYGLLARDGGAADVYLDGVRQSTATFYAAKTARAAVYTSGALSAGEHTIRIVPLGTTPAGSKGSWVALDNVVVGATSYEESALRQAFRRDVVSGASNDSVDLVEHAADRDGRPSYAVTFFGDSVSVYAMTSPDSGSAAVYVDDVLRATVSLNSSATVQQVPVFSSSLGGPAALHTVRIECVGTKDAAKSAVRLDYLSTT